jgi:hypothetical protein
MGCCENIGRRQLSPTFPPFVSLNGLLKTGRLFSLRSAISLLANPEFRLSHHHHLLQTCAPVLFLPNVRVTTHLSRLSSDVVAGDGVDQILRVGADKVRHHDHRDIIVGIHEKGRSAPADAADRTTGRPG